LLLHGTHPFFDVEFVEQRLLLREIYIKVRRQKIRELLGILDVMIIMRACSGASGVSSNKRAAESRKFRNVASHSLSAAAGSIAVDRLRRVETDRSL